MYKKKLIRSALAVILLPLLYTSTASACRFNVRDIGFIDVGTIPYRLFVYVDNKTPTETSTELNSLLQATIMQSNVVGRVVNIETNPNDQPIKYLDQSAKMSLPAAVLVSSDEKVYPLQHFTADQPHRQTLLSNVQMVLSSTLRQDIQQKTAEAFGVILIIEGPDKQLNDIAMQNAVDAIQRTADQMKMLPKTIKYPPTVIALKQKDIPDEKILLWSLGLEPDDTKQPCVAVLYGKSRRLGPVLKGDQVTSDRLMNFLAVIGADCECGLDRSWMLGPSLPYQYDDQLKADLAIALGFDPENPMVKLEVSQILRNSPAQNPAAQDPDAFSGMSLGYQEIVVQFDLPAETQPAETPAPKTQTVDLPQPVTPPQPAQPILPAQPVQQSIQKPDSSNVPQPAVVGNDQNIFVRPLHIILLLTIPVIAVGLFIVFRSTGKN